MGSSEVGDVQQYLGHVVARGELQRLPDELRVYPRPQADEPADQVQDDQAYDDVGESHGGQDAEGPEERQRYEERQAEGQQQVLYEVHLGLTRSNERDRICPITLTVMYIRKMAA